jgi:hypothetical protein
MARRWTDRALLAKLREYLESLHLHEELVTPQEAELRLAILESIRAYVDEEISWLRAEAAALPDEPALGFPGINFVRPTRAGVFESDEE